MRQSRLRILWLAACGLLLACAVPMRARMEQSRVDSGLSLAMDQEEKPPPELALAMSMGVFRSMLLDILWIRAGNLQREGRFYELVQLFDLIGKLQPHDGAAWTHSAWNMAYNVSVEIPNAAERWRWVNNGLDRLRLHGLFYNPADAQLYWELGWIFFHKIGQNMDDAHLFYKTRMAELMQELFTAELSGARAALDAEKGPDSGLKERVRTLRNRLKAEWGMDLEIMADTEADDRFGPLDWRLAEAHAIYWARLGLLRGKYGKREMDLRRLMYQSLQHLMRQGSLYYFQAEGKEESRVVFGPDYRQTGPIVRMFEEQISYCEKSGSSVVGVRSAFYYFAEEALEILWFSGQDKELEELFQKVNSRFPGMLSGRNGKDHIRENLVKRIKDMSGDQLSTLIGAMLFQRYWWQGMGDDRRSAMLLEQAQELWKLNVKMNPNAERVKNRSFRDLEVSVLRDIFRSSQYKFPADVMKKLRARLEPGLRGAAEAGEKSGGAGDSERDGTAQKKMPHEADRADGKEL